MKQTDLAAELTQNAIALRLIASKSLDQTALAPKEREQHELLVRKIHTIADQIERLSLEAKEASI